LHNPLQKFDVRPAERRALRTECWRVSLHLTPRPSLKRSRRRTSTDQSQSLASTHLSGTTAVSASTPAHRRWSCSLRAFSAYVRGRSGCRSGTVHLAPHSCRVCVIRCAPPKASSGGLRTPKSILRRFCTVAQTRHSPSRLDQMNAMTGFTSRYVRRMVSCSIAGSSLW
jgi:hypothetical protein